MKRSLVCLVVLVSLLALSTLAAAGSARAAGAPVQPTWTVAIYANGDNDLMYTWPQFTLPALKRIPSSADVNVVAMLDRPAKDGAWLYKIDGPVVTKAIAEGMAFMEAHYLL